MSGTYEGICKYCGEIQPIMAQSQEEADMLISRVCKCRGAEEEDKRDRICANAEEITEGLDPAITSMMATIGCFIQSGVISKATIKVENITLSVSINSNDQVKFKRKETCEKELQD